MKLLVQSDFRPVGGIIGAGAEEFSWPRPTRPGDILRVECEILETKPSAKNPRQGMLRARLTTLNQSSEPVQIALMKVIVRCRPADQAQG